MAFDIPGDLLYAPTHQWARMEGDEATVGLTAYATKALGAIVWLELPEKGDEVRQGEEFGSAESVKAVSEITCPVSGEVTEVNAKVGEDPKICNADPYGAGWLIRVRLSEKPVGLLDATAYAKLCESLEKENK